MYDGTKIVLAAEVLEASRATVRGALPLLNLSTLLLRAAYKILLLLLKFNGMSSIVSNLLEEFEAARRAQALSQDALAQRAGLSRMTVQRTEAGKIDPRLSTLLVLARSLGLDLMLVPTALRAELVQFARSGGRLLGQPEGVGAPLSVVDELLLPAKGQRRAQASSRKRSAPKSQG